MCGVSKGASRDAVVVQLMCLGGCAVYIRHFGEEELSHSRFSADQTQLRNMEKLGPVYSTKLTASANNFC